jgi:hypothetical protein
VYGDFTPLDAGAMSPTIFTYVRSSGTRNAVVVLNFSAEPAELDAAKHMMTTIHRPELATLRCVLTTYDSDPESDSPNLVGYEQNLSIGCADEDCREVLKLRPYEGRLYVSTVP